MKKYPILCVIIFALILTTLGFAQTNLLVNPDLETLQPNFWTAYGNDQTGVTCTWAWEGYDNSLHSFKIEKTAATEDPAGWLSANNAQLYWNHAEADMLYNLSFRAKTMGVNVNPATQDEMIGVAFAFFVGGLPVGQTLVPIDQSTADSDWTEYTDGFLLPAGDNPDQIYATVVMGKDATGTVWFDNIGCGTDPWTMGIFNGDAEVPLGWMEWHAGGDNLNFANLDSAEAHSGDWSALMRERDDEGDEMVFYSEPVPAKPGAWYEISVWAKWDSINTDPKYLPTNAIPDFDDNRLGMCFFFHRLDLRNAWELTGGDQFFYFDQRNLAGGWVQYHVIAQAPDDAVGLSCRARFNPYPKGYVWYDDFAIEEITVGPNILVNPDLETYEPNFWTPMGNTQAGVTCTWADEGYDNSLHSFKIEKTGATAQAATWKSDNNAQLYWNHAEADLLYNLSFRAKTQGVNTDPGTEGAKIGVLFQFSGGGAELGQKFVEIDQSTANTDWTEYTDGLLIPAGVNPDQIVVELIMGSEAIGTVWFDNVGCGTDPWTMGIFNGDAEIPVGWMEWHAGGENMNYSNLDDTYAHSGTYSALLRERDDEGDEMVFYSEPALAYPGQWYKISVWAKWDSINTDPGYLPSNVIPDMVDDRLGICFFFHRLDLLNAWELTGGDQFFYFDQRDTTGGWTQYFVKAKAPDDAVGVSLRARFNPYPKGYVWYDDFAIEPITIIDTGVEEWERGEAEMPMKFELSQNYPNPFNPSTQIGYNITSAGPVKLEVYNMMGQRIRTLVDEERPAGSYRVMWDGTDDAGNRVVSGVYFYRLQTAKSVSTKRMVLVK